MDNVLLPYHRKYRPSSLSKYIGNKDIVNSVLGSMRKGNRPQIILLSGQAGCGKTSLGRLIVKEYLCEDRDDDLGSCGVCGSCKELETYIESGSTDNLAYVKEVDNTDSNKKQDIEALIEEALFPAFGGGWKTYIFDEAHMLSNASQSRLLKFTEEPPEKVLIVFCTTDPEKMLETLLSRCQYKFKVKKPKIGELVNLLAQVCHEENLHYEPKALAKIAVKCDFVPRTSLITLEQIVHEKLKVTMENTLEVLGDISEKYYYEFMEHIVSDAPYPYEYINLIVTIKEKMDLEVFILNLISFIKRGIYVFYGVKQEGLDDLENKQLSKLFTKFDRHTLSYLLNFLLDVRKDPDIETKLILLGYEQPYKQVNMLSSVIESQQQSGINSKMVIKESQEAQKSFQAKLDTSEDEVEELYSRGRDSMSVESILDLFQGSVVSTSSD